MKKVGQLGRVVGRQKKIGMVIYTTFDYAKIIDHLVKFWKLEELTGLNGAAQKAQNYLCKLSERYMRIGERMKVPQELNLAWLSV